MTAGVADARSLLFVPGDREDRFIKAGGSGADAVICDLEDAVAEGNKDQARQAAARWLAGQGVAWVRVNAAGTAHFEADCAALKGLAGLSCVVLPMADDPHALAALHQQLGPQVAIVALVETARGVLRATELASVPGVTRLAFGALDFAADISASDDHDALLLARSTLVLASRAAGIAAPIDTVSINLDDPGAAGVDARAARRLGFGGKLCIHPRQVGPVNDAFQPSEDEVAWARRVVELAAGAGAVRVDGQMVDQPVVQRAQAILQRAARGAQERAENGATR